MPLIGINSNACAGATTCAKFINKPIVSLTSELYNIYNMLYEPIVDDIDRKMIFTRKSELFSHPLITPEDIEKLVDTPITARFIMLLLDKIIRDKDPYYFVKQHSDIIKNTTHLTITDIKTNVEAMYLKSLRPDLVIIQVKRLTEYEGIYDGNTLDKRYVTKQLLNVSDLGTLEIKLKVILRDLFGI
jgi:hypothetical protein